MRVFEIRYRKERDIFLSGKMSFNSTSIERIYLHSDGRMQKPGFLPREVAEDIAKGKKEGEFVATFKLITGETATEKYLYMSSELDLSERHTKPKKLSHNANQRQKKLKRR